ncbi:MAG: NAD-dependent isocitrate dehydrogenase, partial [Deltaproteobacteria bacterium]|nr:NAD-dependent isocitrate dehydrogenase [Deltaproteobacteria bacterium]
FARMEGRRKVTTVHKANIMKLADGLFLECSREVSKEYPDIEYEETIIDNTCMQLVKNPHRFDVLLMENLYGDIVSDLCAGLVGGLGVVPGANIGEGIAIFEAVHGTAPDIAGKGFANPTAVTFSACMLLDYINERKRADAIREAVRAVYREGRALTPDLGGKAGVKQFTDAVIDKLASKKV